MELFNNFAKTTLTADINADDATINVASGSVFPAPANGDYFMVVLAKPSAGEETTWEICKCTARNNNTLTVVRGQEGTTAKNWAIGDKAENRLTAGSLQRLSSSSSNGGGMTYGGKVTITASTTLDDPSEGRGREFRITIVGGGGGGYADNSNERYLGGGGGESIVMMLYKSEITWPVQITIGAKGIGSSVSSPTAGGSSSFGSLVTAMGGGGAIPNNNTSYRFGGDGGGARVFRNRVNYAYVYSSTVTTMLILGGQGARNSLPEGADSSVIQTDRATYYSGGGGGLRNETFSNSTNTQGGKCGIQANPSSSDRGGCSLLANSSISSGTGYGHGGGGSSGLSGGLGVCIIEWFE